MALDDTEHPRPLGMESNELTFQWPSFPDLVVSPAPNNNKTDILKTAILLRCPLPQQEDDQVILEDGMIPEGRALIQLLLAQPEANSGAEDRSGGWRSPPHLLGPPPGLSDRPHGQEAPFLWLMARAFSEGLTVGRGAHSWY